MKFRHFWALTATLALLPAAHADLVFKDDSAREVRLKGKTDVLNERSRSAILRIGAKEEGTFRQHMVTESGRLRDSVYFSIIDSEWRQVKKALAEKLQISN